MNLWAREARHSNISNFRHVPERTTEGRKERRRWYVAQTRHAIECPECGCLLRILSYSKCWRCGAKLVIGFNVFDWRRFPVFVNVPGAMLYGFVSFLLMLLVITVVGDSVFGLLVAVIWELYKGHK